MKYHAALILAAGGSLRLGQTKQLLRRSGETLVHRVTRLAHATDPGQLLVVVGADRERVEAEISDLPCTVIFNSKWHTGLASTLRAAAPALAKQEVLIVGCDQPALELNHLRALLGPDDARHRYAATLHGSAKGVPAMVPAAWFEDLDALTADHGFGARLGRLPEDELFLLRVPELEFDVDTQDDLARAVARGCIDSDG